MDHFETSEFKVTHFWEEQSFNFSSVVYGPVTLQTNPLFLVQEGIYVTESCIFFSFACAVCLPFPPCFSSFFFFFFFFEGEGVQMVSSTIMKVVDKKFIC